MKRKTTWNKCHLFSSIFVWNMNWPLNTSPSRVRLESLFISFSCPILFRFHLHFSWNILYMIAKHPNHMDGTIVTEAGLELWRFNNGFVFTSHYRSISQHYPNMHRAQQLGICSICSVWLKFNYKQQYTHPLILDVLKLVQIAFIKCVFHLKKALVSRTHSHTTHNVEKLLMRIESYS